MLFQTCLVFFFSFICDEKEKESCAWKFDEAWRGDSRPSDGDQVTLLFIYLFFSSRAWLYSF